MVVRSSDWVTERVPRPADLGRTYSRELTIDSLYRQPGDAALTAETVLREERSEVPAHTRYDFRQRNQEDADTLLGNLDVPIRSDRQFYRIDDETTYLARFAESTAVPDGRVGLVAPREALLSMGVTLQGTFVGPREGTTGATVVVDDQIACVEADAPVAELVVWTPEDTGGESVPADPDGE